MIQQYDNRWKGDLPLQRVDCPMCGHDRSRPAHQENGFTVERCSSCAFVFVNPRPRPEDLAKFYQTYYPHDADAERSWETMMHRLFCDARDRVVRFADSGRVLDVGTGLGYFLDHFKDTNWEAIGVDLSVDVAARARERGGVDVRGGSLESQNFPDEHFDAVTLFYILEHTLDPIGFLREVTRHLRPGGMVFIRVPHMEPLIRLCRMLGWPRIFFHPPMHLCDMGPEYLEPVLGRLGYKEVHTTVGRPSSPPTLWHKLVSLTAGNLALAMEKLTAGAALFPGVSKTTIAFKKGLR